MWFIVIHHSNRGEFRTMADDDKTRTNVAI